MRIRSLTATRCGEVYKPAIQPVNHVHLAEKQIYLPTFHSGLVWRMMESVKAHVEPFPFVPVICTTFNLFRSAV